MSHLIDLDRIFHALNSAIRFGACKMRRFKPGLKELAILSLFRGKRIECEYFHKTKLVIWFTSTSITSRKLHFKSSRSSNSLQKIHTQNQSSALIGYPSLFLTILKRTTEATLSTLRQPGSIQQLYIIHHTK